MNRSRSWSPRAGAAALLVSVLAVTGCASTGATGATNASMASGSSISGGPMSSGPMSSSPTSGSPMSAAAPAAAGVSIKDFSYAVPASVSPGAVITVVNEDSEAHTVTSDTRGVFDDAAGAGTTTTFTAPSTPGRYPFHCKYHDNMHGVLVVA